MATDSRKGRERPADGNAVGAGDAGAGTRPEAEQGQEIQKAGRYRVYFRLYEKAIFKDIFVEVGVPEAIVVSMARDAIKDSLELIRYVPIEETEEPAEGEDPLEGK